MIDDDIPKSAIFHFFFGNPKRSGKGAYLYFQNGELKKVNKNKTCVFVCFSIRRFKHMVWLCIPYVL